MTLTSNSSSLHPIPLKTYSPSKPLTVIVKRRRWLRGEEADRVGAFLLHPDNAKMCCLGFACRAIGIKRAAIKDLVEPRDVGVCLPGLTKNGAQPSFLRNTAVAGDLMVVNDTDEIEDATREKRITTLGKRIGLRFQFVD